MVSVIDSEKLTTGFDVMPDMEESVLSTQSRVIARKIYRAPVMEHQYAKTVGGIVAMVALFSVPFFTLPGMMIPVLIAEVYLLDWTYSKFSHLRGSRLSVLSASAAETLEDKIDSTVTRTSPREQFLK